MYKGKFLVVQRGGEFRVEDGDRYEPPVIPHGERLEKVREQHASRETAVERAQLLARTLIGASYRE